MILFKKIIYRNFLSAGNHFVEFDLSTHKTNLIIGTNGTGKSTVLDALTFSLYGKSYRKSNKPQLINSINEKDCVVQIEFSIGKTNWKVTRGIKPNIFEIEKDGQILNQLSDSTDQQKWLEQNVLKMNYKSFTQLVILGSSAYVPFMQLQTAHRREVIEDLLDIKIFSSMNLVIKDKIRKTKDEIKTLELRKESLTDKIKMQEEFIKELENRGNANIETNKEKIKSLKKEIDLCISSNDTLDNEVASLQKELEAYVGAAEKLRKFGTLKGKISQKISTITTDHKFFNENNVCPTCTQNIDESFRLNKINEFKNKAKELQSGYKELEQAIKQEEEREQQFITVSKEITKLSNEVSQNNIKITEYQKQIRNLESEIQTITSQFENRNIENEKLEDFKNNFDSTFNELCTLKDQINYYNFTYDLLKDGGVKAKIIKKYLPLINKQVNSYLQMMDFYINFTLDEEFNESVKSPIHENFTYSSFSEGEKARINLALIFAWREIAKLKNSINCNIIFFDEVFDGSLDTSGTDDFLKIISYVIKDANIFVISHKNGLEDRFEKVIEFQKIKGFSSMVK